MANEINNLRIPQISELPKKEQASKANQLKSGEASEFNQILNNNINQATPELKISNHAAKRLAMRNINLDGNEYMKLKEAWGKLKQKGGQDSLVVTDKAAYILDVSNGKVVTAVDKNDMSENVFTKIDSTLFMN